MDLMNRKALRSILMIFEEFCGRLTTTPVTRSRIDAKRKIENHVNTVTFDILRMNPPSVQECAEAESPTFYAEVYNSPRMLVSVFGLRGVNDKIPLHDHPRINGFIKVLQGKFEITSFSTRTHVAPELCQEVEVLYEGVKVVTPADFTVYLAPGEGNIHQIRALEPASFFFDVLMPGYDQFGCAYYEMPAEPLPPPQSILTLKRVTDPSTYHSITIDYLPIYDL